MTVSGSDLFDFAMITIFAREFLEGSIIIGEYRTIVVRSDENNLSFAPGVTKDDALNAITIATLAATALALFVIACVAIPLAILSSTFDPNTGYIIEGVSKIVAALSLLQLSLKIPKLFGIYARRNSSKGRLFAKQSNRRMNLEKEDDEVNENPEFPVGLTLRSIRFNVAWNIWREVAEIGAFLLPSFLSNTDLQKLPLSAVVGALVGTLVGVGIYLANKRLTNKKNLCIFVVLLIVILSAGLYTGGSHNLETAIGSTKEVWKINGDFWSVNRLPMTIFKPFGYNDSRTVLEIVSFWCWLLLCAVLHYCKFRTAHRVNDGGNSDMIPGESDGEKFDGDDDISKGYRTVDETTLQASTANDSENPSTLKLEL
jgi:high-affinity iron transporter